MISRVNKSILREDWFKTFSAFRLNPESFLDRRKLTRDAFCLDVLKDLTLDQIEIQSKIHMLLLLQEFSPQLITDIILLEQVVGSLTNLYHVLSKKTDKNLLRSQVLVSIVTILLSLDLDKDISQFIMKTKLLLLEIIYCDTEETIVLSSACSCLEELENFYPGILASEIENISLACERQTRPAFQNYALLLNTCVKHMSFNYNKTGEREENNEDPISPSLSSILAFLPLMSHIAQYRVLRDFINVVKNVSKLSPKIFKLYFSNLVMSSKVPFFHIAFDLQEAFGLDLLTAQDGKILLKQLIKLSTHPCLSSSHRLLYLEWLKCYVKYNDNLSSYLSSSDLERILPSPFDGPLTQEKKAHILTLCIPPNSEERFCGELLNETVSGLMKCSLMPGGIKAAPSLFRTLFIYFSLQTSEAVSDSIYKLFIGIMKTSLHLTPYALSFLQSVKLQYSDRKFHEKALDHMVEHILSVPVKQVNSNLLYYLAVLENSAQEKASICKPRAALRVLQKLSSNANLDPENTWIVGNSILSYCRALMKHHDVQIFYYDLAEVLCLISQQFKDTDVKDRAKIYYSMLTSLSKIKVQTIFNLNSAETEGKSTLNSFVTGSDSFQFSSSVRKLSKPVIELIRSEKQKKEQSNESINSIEAITNISEIYFQHLISEQSFLEIPFIVKHVSDVEKEFSNLYSIVITTQSEPACKETSVIQIPVLNQHLADNNGRIVALRIIPLEPCPLSLHFKAEFTCCKGYSYICPLQSIVLYLEDLFLPLPVPKNYLHCQSSWRKMLFEALWEEFSRKVREKESRYCQSVYALKLKTESFSSCIEKMWDTFIVSNPLTSEYNIAIYMPFQNHILFKISIVNQKPFINILVDNNQILPWLTLYLQTINENNQML